MRPTILYVDDEPEALQAFSIAFEEDFRILTAEFPTDGLAELRKNSHHIAAVIADQRMPEMTGLEFLELTRLAAPRASRYLVAAYSELKVLVAAVNSGAVHRYIEKPWDPETLFQVLKNSSESWENERSDGASRIKGRFQQHVIMNRYGELLQRSKTLTFEYTVEPSDLDTVIFTRAVDEHGCEVNPVEIHYMSVFHALKSHILHRQL